MPRSRRRGGTRTPRSGDETTLPAMLISPDVGCSSPATQRSVVVLPQPEGPSSTTISPAGTAKLTPSIAGRPIANCLRRSVTSSVASRKLPVLERINHVLPHGHVRPDRIGLKHHAEVAQARRHQDAAFGRRYDPAGNVDFTRCRVLQPRDAAQRRGLAAAGGTEQNHDLAGRHGKTDAIDRRPADRKMLAQVGDFEGCRHRFDRFPDLTITARSHRSCSTRPPRPRATSRTHRTWGTRP